MRFRWKMALLHALVVSAVVLGLYYYWFAVANRYVIFLYGHRGATPFDQSTQERYRMSGLVAGGVVSVMYVFGNWFWGRVAGLRYRTYDPPPWWQVWLLCVPPLTVGVLGITMRLNHPVLPASSAASCLLAVLLALALALPPGSLAAREPSQLGWLALYGVGLIPALLLLRAVELPGRGLLAASRAYPLAIASTLGGTAWLGIAAYGRSRRREPRVGAKSLLATGLCLSYLLLPLAHYLFFVPPQYRYISAASNFFAFIPGVQALCLVVAAAQALGFSWLQDRLSRRATP